jgi:hypothetical protein
MNREPSWVEGGHEEPDNTPPAAPAGTTPTIEELLRTMVSDNRYLFAGERQLLTEAADRIGALEQQLTAVQRDAERFKYMATLGDLHAIRIYAINGVRHGQLIMECISPLLPKYIDMLNDRAALTSQTKTESQPLATGAKPLQTEAQTEARGGDK